ncbi:biotin transport system substrate-specific component [Bartonella sp. Raccoon60]|nr:biotin transport system substrate-specific component [Bartonella sp. Raccoon60]
MTTKDLTYISLFAALYAVLGFFPPIFLPFFLGLPITAQSMGPMLAGSILGAKRGAAASALFLFLVAIGLPLLAGGRGGIGVFGDLVVAT